MRETPERANRVNLLTSTESIARQRGDTDSYDPGGERADLGILGLAALVGANRLCVDSRPPFHELTIGMPQRSNCVAARTADCRGGHRVRKLSERKQTQFAPQRGQSAHVVEQGRRLDSKSRCKCGQGESIRAVKIG